MVYSFRPRNHNGERITDSLQDMHAQVGLSKCAMGAVAVRLMCASPERTSLPSAGRAYTDEVRPERAPPQIGISSELQMVFRRLTDSTTPFRDFSR